MKIIFIFSIFLINSLFCNEYLNIIYNTQNDDIVSSYCKDACIYNDNLYISEKIKFKNGSEKILIKRLNYSGNNISQIDLNFQNSTVYLRGMLIYDEHIYLQYISKESDSEYIDLIISKFDMNLQLLDSKIISTYQADVVIGDVLAFNSNLYTYGGYKIDNSNDKPYLIILDEDLNELDRFEPNNSFVIKSLFVDNQSFYLGLSRILGSYSRILILDHNFAYINDLERYEYYEGVESIMVLNNYIYTLTTGSYGNPFLSKFDIELNLVQEKSFGGDLFDNQVSFSFFENIIVTTGSYNASFNPFHAFNANVTFLDYNFDVISTLIYDDNVTIASTFYNMVSTEYGRLYFVGSYNNCAWLFESDLEGNYNPIAPIEENIAEYIKFYNYPNPFNPETNICFYLESSSNVDLSIYNLKGEKVTSIYNGFLDKGDQSFSWKPLGDLSSGVYFSVLEINGDKRIAKMIYNK